MLREKKTTINLQEIGLYFPEKLPPLLTNSPKFEGTDFVLQESHIGADDVKFLLASIDWVKVEPPEKPSITFGDWFFTRLDQIREKHKEKQQIDLKRTALYIPLVLDVAPVTLRRNRLFYSKDGQIILNCYDKDTGRTLFPPQWGLDIQAEYLRMKEENEFLRHLLVRKETSIENLMRALRHWDMTVNHLEAMLTQSALLFSQTHAERLQLRQDLAQIYSQLRSETGLRLAMTKFKKEYYRMINEEFAQLLSVTTGLLATLVKIVNASREAIIKQKAISETSLEKLEKELKDKMEDIKTAVTDLSLKLKEVEEKKELEVEK